MLPLVNTKIIATLGPASNSAEKLEALIDAGVNAFRLNFSHGDHSFFEQLIATIREIGEKKNLDIPIIQDLQGPKIRLNKFTNEQKVNTGEKLDLPICDHIEDSMNRICIAFPGLANEVKPGQRVLIDDGNLELKITGTSKDQIMTIVQKGGTLKPRKGVNLPDTKLSLPSLTEKDIKDLEFGSTQKIDYVALSFVRSHKDILELKNYLKKFKLNAGIIAKIEKPEALMDIEAIADISDVILLARGDLGVEINLEQVPSAQKKVVEVCRIKNTPVIIATQMLETMTNNPVPTRAEVTDVYQAVSDGADIVMLSGETAVGNYPVETVIMMKKIIAESEKNLFTASNSLELSENTDKAIALTSAEITNKIKAKFICSFTYSGWTARLLSKTNTRHPIIAFTPLKSTRRRINLYRGVKAFHVQDNINTVDKLIETANDELKKLGIVNPGDKIVIVAGQPLGRGGITNLLKVHTVI
ncbi:MAG: pyruvate kinase [Proteobacteria bacterium]|nr:pyruvate kinase [Pseudomonadota bacterium]